MTSKVRNRRGPQWLDAVRSSRARRGVFIGFFAVTAVLGGGSRSDILSLIVLRPIAVLACAYALSAMPPGHLEKFRWLILLCGAAALAIGWQLVPLPPALWQSLPWRGEVALVDHLAGLGDIWRAAALSPAAAWNALFALFVPLAAVLLYLALDPVDRPVALGAIAIFAMVSAAVGLFQLVGSATGPLYFYRITNAGLPVGLFSNRNHQAVFLASALPVLALWVKNLPRKHSWTMPAAIAAFGMVLLVILLSGSRAGFLTAMPAAMIAAMVMKGAAKPRSPAQAATRTVIHQRLVTGAAASITLALVALFVTFKRGLAITRVSATSPAEELRFQTLPEIFGMASELWTTGAGAGAFALAYQRVEPTALLRATYLNNAHNDWLQVVIELGVPGILVVLAFLVVILRALRTRLSMRSANDGWAVAAIFAVAVILAVASLVDYPLRTPSIAMFALLWTVILADPDTVAFIPRSRR